MTTVRESPNPAVSGDWQLYPHCNTPLTSSHTGIVHVLLADGSVRPLSDSMSFETLARICDRSDGKVLGGEF
jgi:hypothetical protein